MSGIGSKSEFSRSFALFCDVCFEDFDNADMLPKVVPCGHTFCAKCLRCMVRAKEGESIWCPKCKAPITIRSVESLPTNLLLLQMVSNSAAKYYKEDEEATKVHVKEKLRRLTRMKENVNEKDVDYMNPVGLKDSKSASQVTLGAEAGEIEMLEKSNEKSLFFEKDFNAEKSSVPFKKPIAFTLNDFKVPLHFLQKIFFRLLKCNMYSMHFVAPNKIRYGRIELDAKHGEYGEYIFVHSLTLDDVEEESADYVLFSDIKKCATEDNYEAFLKFCKSNGEAEFASLKIFNSAPNLSQRLINLCTGEAGHTFSKMKFNSFIVGLTCEQQTSELVASEDLWPMMDPLKWAIYMKKMNIFYMKKMKQNNRNSQQAYIESHEIFTYYDDDLPHIFLHVKTEKGRTFLRRLAINRTEIMIGAFKKVLSMTSYTGAISESGIMFQL